MHSGRIGPNAIVRVAEAIDALLGRPQTEAIFLRAGLSDYLARPPKEMVDESHVAQLQLQLRTCLSPELAKQVATEAGRRTADYLLAHRIPWLAQTLLRRLPARIAASLLARAIAKHAWTFSGSGEFSFKPGKPFVFVIRRNPLCSLIQADAPVCHYYTATFQGIFRAIVHKQASAVEVECESAGAAACRFELSW